ncbi:MAG TPA: helix-turn-helix transcriptional regulator [Solirubrobacterales bacterium]|nr:helix-turn-helix transcriptional regulator [Solirubrobacterales bacterium]
MSPKGTQGRRHSASPALSRRFGLNLVLLRSRAGYSQHFAAERSGLHRTEISFLERGQRMPQLDTIVKLAGAIDAAPDELLAGMSWRLAKVLDLPGRYLEESANDDIEHRLER